MVRAGAPFCSYKHHFDLLARCPNQYVLPMQMREARRLELESNPNYLKSGSSSTSALRKAAKPADGGAGGDSETSSSRTSVSTRETALAAVELAGSGQRGIPIPGLASSEKYLEEERHKQHAAEQEAKLGACVCCILILQD